MNYRKFTSDEDESVSTDIYPSSLSRSNIFQIYSSFCDKSVTKFITYNPVEHKFDLFSDARLFFATITGKLFVISVSGPPCVGKSTLLNLLTSMINHLIECQGDARIAMSNFDHQMPYRDIFKVGNGSVTTTEELDYVCLKWGRDYILFLDLEGNDDPKRGNQGKWIYSNLISTSLALSHIHLYNFKGIPDTTFLTYFTDIMKILSQAKLDKEFKPVVYLVKKDERKRNLQEPEEAIRDQIENTLTDNRVDYEIEVLNTPPDCLFQDCMNQEHPICDNCKNHPFITGVKGLARKIFVELGQMTPYRSGQEFLNVIDQVLNINQRNLIPVRDNGVLSNYKVDRLRSEQVRIRTELSNIRASSDDRKFSQNILELFKDRPQLIENNVWQKFKDTLDLVYDKLPKIDYLGNVLTNFVDKLLKDNSFSVLNDQGVELEIETYVDPFVVMMRDVLRGFEEFHGLLKIITEQLDPLQAAFREHLKDYLRAKSYHRAQNAVLSIPMSASFLNIVARDVAFKACTMGLAGMGILVGLLAAYAWAQTNKKFKESKEKGCLNLNLASIPDWKEGHSEQKQMEVVEKYLKDTVMSIQEKNNEIRLLFENRAPDEVLLRDQVKRMLNTKKNGVDFSKQDKQELRILLGKVTQTVNTLKTCI